MGKCNCSKCAGSANFVSFIKWIISFLNQIAKNQYGFECMFLNIMHVVARNRQHGCMERRNQLKISFTFNSINIIQPDASGMAADFVKWKPHQLRQPQIICSGLKTLPACSLMASSGL